MKDKILAVIQTTNLSPTLSNKSLIKINKQTVLEIIYKRLKSSRKISDIVAATTVSPEDDSIIKECRRLKIKYYRGSTENVLERIYKAAVLNKAEYIVKILGNYPLIDVKSIDDLILQHIKRKADFSYNEHFKGIIYGMGCEVITLNKIKEIFRLNLNYEQLESGTLFFKQHSGDYKLFKQKCKLIRPNYKLALENLKDLALIEEIFKKIKNPNFKKVVEFLDLNPVLAKMNKYESIKEVGLDKIFLFPEKIKAVKSVFNNGKIDLTYPISIELSLTNKCNMHCVWCSDKKLRERYPYDLAKEIIFKLIQDLKIGGTKGIVIEGGGEPTLHKDFEEIAEAIKQKNLSIGLITNGTNQIKLKTLEKIDWIRVSLDASSKVEYHNYKGREIFEEVMKMAEHHPLIGVGYVVTKYNVENLEILIFRLKEYQVKYLQLRPVIDREDLSYEGDLSYLKKYETENFDIILEGMEENKEAGNNNLPCVAHSLTSVISADGSVYICGRLNIYDWFNPIGNIKLGSFLKIWRGEKRKLQSKKLLENEFCQKYCPQCRISKFNLFFKNLEKVETSNFI
ncbi:MAG: radical SAM protein [Armatimonadetes bacterium]|nr:radical SAM protein [Armatimonadota bacterium]